MSGTVRSADIAELRAFCAAVDLGSLGRAARLLRVSQPALSKRLRVLEALAGARLLDGYAGTGAVGIEAISRGALEVTFVEHDRRAQQLRNVGGGGQLAAA